MKQTNTDTDPRAEYIKRLQDAWKGEKPVDDDSSSSSGNETLPHHVQHDAGRVKYINSRIADRMNDSRVQLHDSVGPSTLPSTGAALRQIREDRQRQGATS